MNNQIVLNLDDRPYNGQSGYIIYIKDEKWQPLKKLAKERDGFRCVICNSKKDLEVHHRYYPPLEKATIDCLTTLCSQCHDLVNSKIQEIRNGVKMNNIIDDLQKRVSYAQSFVDNLKRCVNGNGNSKFIDGYRYLFKYDVLDMARDYLEGENKFNKENTGLLTKFKRLFV